MASQIENIYSKQAEEQLKNILKNLEKIHREQMALNQLALNVNSGTASNPQELQRVLNMYNELEQRYIRLERRLQAVNEQRQRGNARTSEEIVNQRALAQASDRHARATSALVGAYANLNAQHQIASTRLQNLIARGQTATQTQREYNRELREAQRDFDRLNQRVLSADRAVGRFNRNVGNYPRQAIAGIRDLIGAFGIVGGVSLFAGIATDIFRTTKELQSLDNALKQVTGTQEQFARSQAFLREISEDYGIEINGLTTQFTQFYVSAKDKLSGTEIENIFRSISKAGATLGLSVDAQNRAFTALNQMMSKGVVSAEELRGQLGEALPGAFGIMAKAMGTTEVGLAKLMKDGKVLANEVLPKFAQELEKVYGIETIDRIETLTASQNRFSNSWTEFIRNLNEGSGDGSRAVGKLIDKFTELLNKLSLLEAYSDKKGTIFFDKWRKGVENLVPQETLDAVQYFNKELEKTNEIAKSQESTIKTLKERLKIEQESFGYKYLANYGKATKIQEDLDNATKKYNATLLAKQYLESGIINKQAERTKLEDDFVKAFIARNKGVSESIALDYAKQKTDAQLKRELGLLTDETDKNTKGTKENTKAKKENEILTIGSEKWLNKQISDLRELNSTLSTTTEEYQVGVGAIKFYEQWLERLRGTAKKTKEELDGVSLDLGGSEFITDIDGDELMRQGDELRAWYKEFRQGFQDDFWANSGFDKIQFIIENFEELKQSGTDMALAISEAFQQAFNTISQMSDANYQRMYDNLERQRDTSILFAGESVTARSEIERVYEERRKRIQRQQAESQKKLAMFNIVVNMAQGIMSTIAQNGFPAAIPMIVAIGAIGAAQLALTASQPIPQFAVGTQNAPEGLAWTDERGAELHTDKNGKIKDFGSNKGARLKKLEKGDKIYTASQTKKILDLYSFNKEYDNIMLTNGIAPAPQVGQTINLDPIRNELISLKNVVANKSEVTIMNNESGTRYYERVNGQRRELVNSVLTMKSRSVR